MEKSEDVKGVVWIVSLFLICFLHCVVGLLAKLGSHSAHDVYANIQLPSFAPKADYFFPIWIGMYTAISISLWRVWLSRDRIQADSVYGVYGTHLLLQILWAWLSFNTGRVDVALLVMVIMCSLTFWLMCLFWRVNLLAGLLMTIYQLWLSFTLVMNFYVLWLNGVQLGS